MVYEVILANIQYMSIHILQSIVHYWGCKVNTVRCFTSGTGGRLKIVYEVILPNIHCIYYAKSFISII